MTIYCEHDQAARAAISQSSTSPQFSHPPILDDDDLSSKSFDCAVVSGFKNWDGVLMLKVKTNNSIVSGYKLLVDMHRGRLRFGIHFPYMLAGFAALSVPSGTNTIPNFNRVCSMLHLHHCFSCIRFSFLSHSCVAVSCIGLGSN